MVVGESMVSLLLCLVTPVFLLTTSGGLAWFGVLSIEAFECFSQIDPGYLEGIPLGDQEFVFDISLYSTRDVAES